ncbi:MAG: hypothetical protein ACPHM3_04810 [Candidatus Kariarchaeum pelagius]
MFEFIYKLINYIYSYSNGKQIEKEFEEIKKFELSQKEKNLIDSQVDNYQSVLKEMKDMVTYKDALLSNVDKKEDEKKNHYNLRSIKQRQQLKKYKEDSETVRGELKDFLNEAK